MASEVTATVENIELEAQKKLQQAHARAKDILVKSKNEASKYLTAELPMDDVKAESEKIIHDADEQSKVVIADSEKRASGIKAGAAKKIDKIVKKMVNNVIGAE